MTNYPVDDEKLKIFKYQKPTPEQNERFDSLTREVRFLARLILKYTPPSREQSLAITNFQQVRMWANGAIALNEVNQEEIPGNA